MTNIDHINEKIEKIRERREKVETSIKALSVEAQKLTKQMDELEERLKLMLCGQFRDLLEKNAISIKEVDLDEIVKVISANKDVYTAKKSASALSADAMQVSNMGENEKKGFAVVRDDLTEPENEGYYLLQKNQVWRVRLLKQSGNMSRE